MLFDEKSGPPGDHMRDMLKERGWTQDDLAAITGRSRQQINEIVSGRRGITPEMATALGAAFGTSPSFWLKLESAFRLTQIDDDSKAITERAQLFQLSPVKDMMRRGWINETKDMEVIRAELCRFFGIASLEGEPQFQVSTRRSDSLSDLATSQRAWCFRARNIATQLAVSPFQTDSLERAREDLRSLAAHPKDARHVSEVLSKYGIRFLIVEPLRASQIDGAAFWVGPDSPTIALSLRYDRVDYFWHTLMHEFAHIVHLDSLSIDTHLVGDGQSPPLLQEEAERRANESAAQFLISTEDLDSFMRRVGPLYGVPKIIGFAKRIRIHPAIVVGQLQHRGEIGWNAHRKLLEKVRDIVTDTSVVDGWGRSLPPSLV